MLLSWCLSAQEWHEDYKTALQLAKNDEKPLIIVFSGSDWCAPCIKLEHQVWESKEFKTQVSQDFVIYRADFPRKKKNQPIKFMKDQNKVLAAKFNPNGYFPWIVVLNGDEELLGNTGYQKGGIVPYINFFNTFLQ